MLASWGIVWGGWKALHPDTGYNRAYDVNPNTEYERLDNKSVLMDVPIDDRRPPQDRVPGVLRASMEVGRFPSANSAREDESRRTLCTIRSRVWSRGGGGHGLVHHGGGRSTDLFHRCGWLSGRGDREPLAHRRSRHRGSSSRASMARPAQMPM
jgi:hypothetical protein